MSVAIWDRDTLSIRVPVAREDTGLPLDLTGATVLALAGRPGAPSVAGTCSVPTPPTGEITVIFAPAALGTGAWTVQVTVTLGGETQTVAEVAVLVKRSHGDP